MKLNTYLILQLIFNFLVVLIFATTAHANTVTVSVTVPCTLNNYIKSNCVPEELLEMKVDVCQLIE